MAVSTEQLVEAIHASDARIVLAISGGGCGAVGELLSRPGGSRTILEAIVPYSQPAMIAWLGGRPDQFCAPCTARAMAVAAMQKAQTYASDDEHLAGVSCTAGLATDRPKRGEHRVYVAVQTANRTASWSLTLRKDARSRHEEEQIAASMVLNAVADACGLSLRVDIALLEDEQLEHREAIADPRWQGLLLGKTDAACLGPHRTEAVFPGAFNPLHVGHRRMADIAEQVLAVPVAMEMSIVNVDKPPLDYIEIERRVGQFSPGRTVWLTRASTFVEKSHLFPGTTFVVGVDTLRRIAAPRYYGYDQAACVAALVEIAKRGCRFLVFGRDVGTGFFRLSDLDLPDTLRAICREVPPDVFREDISSTAIRRSGAW